VTAPAARPVFHNLFNDLGTHEFPEVVSILNPGSLRVELSRSRSNPHDPLVPLHPLHPFGCEAGPLRFGTSTVSRHDSVYLNSAKLVSASAWAEGVSWAGAGAVVACAAQRQPLRRRVSQTSIAVKPTGRPRTESRSPTSSVRTW